LRAEYKVDAVGGKQENYNIIGTPGALFDGLNFSFDDGTHGTYDVDWPDGIKPILNSEINLKLAKIGSSNGSLKVASTPFSNIESSMTIQSE